MYVLELPVLHEACGLPGRPSAQILTQMVPRWGSHSGIWITTCQSMWRAGKKQTQMLTKYWLTSMGQKSKKRNTEHSKAVNISTSLWGVYCEYFGVTWICNKISHCHCRWTDLDTEALGPAYSERALLSTYPITRIHSLGQTTQWGKRIWAHVSPKFCIISFEKHKILPGKFRLLDTLGPVLNPFLAFKIFWSFSRTMVTLLTS